MKSVGAVKFVNVEILPKKSSVNYMELYCSDCVLLHTGTLCKFEMYIYSKKFIRVHSYVIVIIEKTNSVSNELSHF